MAIKRVEVTRLKDKNELDETVEMLFWLTHSNLQGNIEAWFHPDNDGKLYFYLASVLSLYTLKDWLESTDVIMRKAKTVEKSNCILSALEYLHSLDFKHGNLKRPCTKK